MKYILSFLILIHCIISSYAQISYPGDEPDQAVISKSGRELLVVNNVLKAKFIKNGRKIIFKSFEDKAAKEITDLNAALFEIVLGDNCTVASDDFILNEGPVISKLTENPVSVKFSNRVPGQKISAKLENKTLGLNVDWEVELRNGSNYLRQIYRIYSKNTITIKKVKLVKISSADVFEKTGTVQGLPMVTNNIFVAVEHPMSVTEQAGQDIFISLPRALPVSADEPLTVSSVWGVTPPGQLRRGFLYYMERERAAPYHQILHYNSWSDIAWDDRKMNERICLYRIRAICDNLTIKRNIPMDAFLFDDGWDDNTTLWKFHPGFPNGFNNLRNEVEKIDATLGVWISPFGGYGEAKKQRLEYGKMQTPPFETNNNGFSLSGPVYYDRFKTVLANFIREYDISMLKFDGVGAGYMAEGASIYQKDMESFFKVIMELRDIKPDLFFLLTTGTWPSPFFLRYGDIVWRGGADYGFEGKGSKRQQWITFRDADIYKNVVKRSSLYPLHALQCIGIYVSDIGQPGEFGMNEKDVSDDIWAGFSTGTSVQGLYLNPDRMNNDAWDCLAAAIRWVQENENIMADVHWVGGNPAEGEIYGYAAWSPEKAFLMLRNPSEDVKSFEVDVSKVFELPGNEEKDFSFYDAKANDTPGKYDTPIFKGNSCNIELKPFEVKVFDALPKND